MGRENDNNIYTSGEYIQNNPTLHLEDTPWKIEKITTALDMFIQVSLLKHVRLLDVGGGAGLILKGVSDYLREKNINVNKYALDMSREMLQIQRENNPDMTMHREGGIEKTSFRNKEIDLVLMVDVLEHVSDPVAALKELNRISKYIIFKVPMENNLYYNMLNLVKRGGLRRDIYEKVGHIHFYSFRKLKRQLAAYAGDVMEYAFVNDFRYMLSEGYHRKLTVREKVVFAAGNVIFGISPFLCACMFPASVVCLVQCR